MRVTLHCGCFPLTTEQSQVIDITLITFPLHVSFIFRFPPYLSLYPPPTPHSFVPVFNRSDEMFSHSDTLHFQAHCTATQTRTQIHQTGIAPSFPEYFFTQLFRLFPFGF